MILLLLACVDEPVVQDSGAAPEPTSPAIRIEPVSRVVSPRPVKCVFSPRATRRSRRMRSDVAVLARGSPRSTITSWR